MSKLIIGTPRCIQAFTWTLLLPIKVDVIRMKKNFTTLRLILYTSVGLKKNKKYILAQSVH